MTVKINFNYIYQRIRITLKIKSLQLERAGLDEDGDCYVKLKNGFYFYGSSTKARQKKYYNLLPQHIRHLLPFECFSIAQDIIIRFVEGGLKVGGPPKEKIYKVKQGDFIAEMGAFRGFYTLYLSHTAGANGKIVAIEPMEDNLYFLKKNIAKNNIENVVVVPKGVWSEKKTLTFNRREGDNQSASIDMNYDNKDTFKINVDTLDNILSDLNIENIDFMLIQLNGAEYEAIKGLSVVKPDSLAIAARYNVDGADIPGLIMDYLYRNGYKCQLENKKFIYALNENNNNR